MNMMLEPIQISYKIILMSHYTFTLPSEVYRWMVADQLIPNRGELNEKGIVTLPPDQNATLENGFLVASVIKVILAKAGQRPSSHLAGVVNEQTKNAKATNWNFIWLCFDDLRMQFDQRIRDLILQGESALIPEILKQLYDRDEHKDEKSMKTIIINQKTLLNKSEIKSKNPTKSNTLDIKKVNLQKNPGESESSLEFLILLLGNSFGMPVEQILGLFTNQNKYLAHLLVKGLNDNFEGVVLFYSLLLKHSNKLKQYLERDPKDAESLLYAVKPGLISKSPKVAELSIELFRSIQKIYGWFVSETGRGAATVCLGVKRHPQLAGKYNELMLGIIQNEEMDFFSNHFRNCFRDPAQLVEICTYLLPPLAESFLRTQLIEIGAFEEWASHAVTLSEGELPLKIVSFKFIGAFMGSLPELVEGNEEYLNGIRRGWREYNMVEFTLLMEEILLILEQLASEKKPMARRVYQILIEIMQAIYQSPDKRQYLVRGFTTLIERFPKIPTQYLIESYKEGTVATSDLTLILVSLQHAPDTNSIIKIGQVLVKLFNGQAVLNHFFGPIVFKITKKSFNEEIGKQFALKVLRECLTQYSQLQGSKKVPEVARKQPMYFVQKGNQKYNEEQEQEYLVADKSGKNILGLIQRIIQLILSVKSEPLTLAIKQELMQTNAIIKKNHYKANNKAISNILNKKFAVSREEEQQFNEDFRVKKSLASMEESMAKRRLASSTSAAPMTSSRYTGPSHLKKDFEDLIEKRRKEEEQKRIEDERRLRDQALKKILVKKQLQKTNLLRGFGQQAELKEQGFWAKLMKEDKQQLQLYPPEMMEARDIEYIQNLFKRYHRVLRTLFFKYTSSMYTTKRNTNFEDNKERNQTLNVVELIQFLKDFKLFFLTSKDQIQSLVRDLNVKLLNKRETQELDFFGFQQFIIQFCALIYTKTHTINANTNKGIETIKKNLGHLSHLQLVEQWFNYLKLVFIEKGEKTALFDEPEAAYFNQTEVIKEFTKKIEEDPTFILPQGYKKVTEKVMKLSPLLSNKYTKIKESYKDVMEILDEMLYESDLRMHIIQPMVEKETKVRVKPHAFVNVKAKLLESSHTKVRALSSVIDKKPAIPPVKMLQRKTLSFGMKLGLSYISYKDKLLGQQVAFVIDDMISAVEAGRTSIDKQKIINDYLKKKQEQIEKDKFLQIEKEKKRLQRKNQLQKMKKEIVEKKEKEMEETKEERERKKQKQLSRQKKIRQDKEKYLEEQKKKLQEKKKQEQEEEKKKKETEKNKKEEKKKKEADFKNFNQKQIQKLKKEFDEEAEKKKKQMTKDEEQRKKKEQLVRKLRSKIHQSDKKAIEAKQKMLQQISQLYSSQPIVQVYREFQPSIRALFDFLLKSSYLSITEKKNNSQIIYQTWHYFNLVFQLNPLIIHAKELTKIFRHFTKDKQPHKDYTIGLTYEEFKQALFRIAIKHKSIFNKLSEKIKESMTSGEIDAVVQKDIEEKQKNQFEEPKQIDVRNLIKEEDINKKMTDHYGDLSKVSQKTLKALIYYLKIPKDKQGQEKRFRQILASRISYSLSNIEHLREKLNDEYTLTSPSKTKRKNQGNASQILNVSGQVKQQQAQ